MSTASRPKALVLLDNFFRAPLAKSHILDLSACNLSSLPDQLPDLIGENPSAASRLTQLNLANNSLTTLPQCLAQLPNLRILFLLNNQFSCVPPVVRQLTALRMLSFKQNCLVGMLDANTLPPHLTWLILTSNRITHLSPTFPKQCAQVRKLMLSNNHLSTLPDDFGIEMKALELLRLSNNDFENVPPAIRQCPNLIWFSLAGNPYAGGSVTVAELPKHLSANLDEEYEINWENPFGSGTSGTAFPGVHRKSGAPVAVKKFKSLVGSDGRALDEVKISLAAASVPGVVAARGYCLEKDSAGHEDLALVMELVPGNAHTIAGPPSFESCTRSVYQEGFSLSKQDAATIVSEIEQAVEGLLTEGIAHGDVYGHNILIGELNGKIVVKLGDLGAAWHFEESERECIATLERRAVDVFKREVLSMVK